MWNVNSSSPVNSSPRSEEILCGAIISLAWIVAALERFDFKLKQQFIAPKKIYCIDTGLINSIGFKFSEDKGRIIENAVAIELQRRKFLQDLEKVQWDCCMLEFLCSLICILSWKSVILSIWT